MDSEQLIKAIRKRLGINVAQQILKAAKLPSARSWTEIEAIVAQSLLAQPELHKVLETALALQTISDQKAVSYFTVPEEFSALIERSLREIQVAAGDMTERFPLMVSDDVLKADNGELKVIHKYSDQFGIGIVLSRKREFSYAEEYKRETFTDEMRVQFPEHDKLIAIRNYNRQTFDIVYFNHAHSVVEVRADITRSDELAQTSLQMSKSVDDLHAFTHAIFAQAIGGAVNFSQHNLFPIIKKIYEDPSGAIKKLGFSTSTNSIKHETMKGGVDLRSELFHKFGAEAIQHEMTFFEIAIIWHREDIDHAMTKPELYIPGTYRNSMALQPKCDYAILKGIRTPDDSDFVLRKLLSFETK